MRQEDEEKWTLTELHNLASEDIGGNTSDLYDDDDAYCCSAGE